MNQYKGATVYVTNIPAGSEETWNRAAQHCRAATAFTHLRNSLIHFPLPRDAFKFAYEILAPTNALQVLQVDLETRADFDAKIIYLKSFVQPAQMPWYEF